MRKLSVNLRSDPFGFLPGDVYQDVRVVGVRPGAGPNGEDVVSEKVGHAFLAGDPESFIYDLDGNLTKDGRWEYFWDGESRLAAMEVRDDLSSDLPRWRLQFTYDYMGRRVKRTLHSWDVAQVWNNDEVLHYVYHGWNLLVELDEYQSMAPRRGFVWGLDLSESFDGAGGVGGLLAVRDHLTDTVYYPSYDGNGNVVALTDSSTGTTEATYEYGPFGETIRMTGAAAEINPFRFSTKYQDELSDLYYYGYRYYSPSMGRFLNRDPIEEQGGLNLYGFVNNDPKNRWDYLGLSWQLERTGGRDKEDPVSGMYFVNGSGTNYSVNARIFWSNSGAFTDAFASLNMGRYVSE